jgi:hypothetical protein
MSGVLFIVMPLGAVESPAIGLSTIQVNLRTGDPGQPEAVKAILYNSSVNLGMPPQIQGRGLPLATMALAAAQPSPRRTVWDFPQAKDDVLMSDRGRGLMVPHPDPPCTRPSG